MADWTMSLMDWLRPLKPTGASWEDPNTLRILAPEIFPDPMLDPLPPELRERFAVGFIEHFFLDEIGQETPALFQVRLSGRIYNNAGYIAQLMRLSDEDVFTRLHRRRGIGTTTHGDTTHNNSVTDDTRASVTTGTTKGTGAHDQTSRRSPDLTVTTSNTGDTTGTQSGKNTTNGTTHTANNRVSNTTEATDNDDRYSATPQNGLQPIRDGTYLTNARIIIGNNGTEGTEDATQDGTNSQVQDTTQNQTQNQIQDGTQHTGGTEETTANATTTTTSDNDSTTNATGKAETDALGTSEGYTHRDDEDNDIDIEYDQLFNAAPLMSKVWALFDDLFMMIL